MKALLLRVLRVPERPAPPPGAGDSLEVFRAAPRFLGYSVVSWAAKQTLGLFAIVIPLGLLGGLARQAMAGVELTVQLIEMSLRGIEIDPEAVTIALMAVIEGFAILAYLTQLVVSGLLLKLGWEQRWYMVSDTSLRIREGLVRMREQTLRIANVQNLVIKQGPVQRLFGISDLEVHTAGGGKGDRGESEGRGKQGHLGRFRGLQDPQALRDRLQRALARHRGAGLGDAADSPPPSDVAADQGAGQAVRAVVAEARRLRQVLEARQAPT